MYIAPGQGQTTLGDKILMSTEIPYNFANLLPVFLPFFMCVFFFHMYIPPGRGRQPIGDKRFYDNRKAFSLCSYVASFKMISSKSDFMHIFNVFIHVYSPGARAENTLGKNFGCQQKALIALTNLWILILYTFLMFFPHVYSSGAGAGADKLCGKNPYVNRKALSLCPFVASSKKYLWSLILYIIFHVFIPQGRGRQPLGVRIFI